MVKQVLEKYLRTGKPLSDVLNHQQEKAIRLHCGLNKAKGWGKELTYSIIARRMGLTQSRIQQIIEQGYCKLQYSFICPKAPVFAVKVRNLLLHLDSQQRQELRAFNQKKLKRILG